MSDAGAESTYRVTVLSPAGFDEWELVCGRPDGDWRLVLRGNADWAASGPDLFLALRLLRRQAETAGVLLGCNGARRNAWSAGVDPDEETVSLLSLDSHGVSPVVATLGPAPFDEVGSVSEQSSFMQRWFDAHRQCGEPPGHD